MGREINFPPHSFVHSAVIEKKRIDLSELADLMRYAAAPRVRQMIQHTQLHCIILQFRGWELERMEEVQ